MATDEAEPIIQIRGLVNQFGSQRVHDGLDLDVRAGEVLGVVGGSGTGKSVLLRTIIGLNRSRAGTIKVFGVEVNKISRRERAKYLGRWGVLFQDGALFSSLTVSENIAIPLKQHTQLTQPVINELCALKIDSLRRPFVTKHLCSDLVVVADGCFSDCGLHTEEPIRSVPFAQNRQPATLDWLCQDSQRLISYVRVVEHNRAEIR